MSNIWERINKINGRHYFYFEKFKDNPERVHIGKTVDNYLVKIVYYIDEEAVSLYKDRKLEDWEVVLLKLQGKIS